MEEEFLAIKHLLDEKNIEYQVHEHEAVHTSEQAAQVRGEELHTGVKALVMKTDKTFIMILVPGDKKADFRKLRTITSAKNVRMATPEEVLKITHCEVGSVHPFGLVHGLKTYMDHRILENHHVNFNAGLHTLSIRMFPQDLKEILKPEMVDLVKE